MPLRTCHQMVSEAVVLLEVVECFDAMSVDHLGNAGHHWWLTD